MKRNLKHLKITTLVGMMALVVAIVMTALWVSPLGAAGSGAPRIAPPNSHAYGKTLTEWLDTYWRWYLDGSDMAKSKVGRVQLMPLPTGDCTRETEDGPWTCIGELEITLPPGTPFVLPLISWIGERYAGYPGVPDDLPFPDDVFLAGIHPELKIDGRTIISDANKARFYVPATDFDPIVEYPSPSSYGSVAAIFFQSVGFVSPPLSPGEHVIHLYEPVTFYNLIYDNTWIVTVSPN
jgi:hypothetical protein